MVLILKWVSNGDQLNQKSDQKAELARFFRYALIWIVPEIIKNREDLHNVQLISIIRFLTSYEYNSNLSLQFISSIPFVWCILSNWGTAKKS